jgi:hypothetical protein
MSRVVYWVCDRCKKKLDEQEPCGRVGLERPRSPQSTSASDGIVLDLCVDCYATIEAHVRTMHATIEAHVRTKRPR